MKIPRLYWKVPWSSIAFLICMTKDLSCSSNHSQNKCKFPNRWEGTWFQSGVRSPIIIQDNKLSNKGRCLASEGDKFLVVDEKGVCFRCVVIHEKHANVLQYKETFCHSRASLQTLCALITGDALLYSMFREAAVPVACPFKPPHTFTYNRGHGECRSPISSIDSCTQDSRILLRYQACPDVYGSESAVEELQCLATWKEGSSRYLVGKVHHSHATSNEDRYRCFVYEKTGSTNMVANMEQYGVSVLGGMGLGGVGMASRQDDEDIEFQIAQSGDATCNGLFTPLEGSRTMTLRKGYTPTKCKFPNWLTGSGHWHTLDYKRTYSFHHRNTTLHITNTTGFNKEGDPALSEGVKLFPEQQPWTNSPSDQDSRVVCTELKQISTDFAHLVAHSTTGCQSGFVCLAFYKRDGHVIEVQTGTNSHRQEEACGGSHFDKLTSPYTTLVTSNPEQKICPYAGKYIVSGPKVKQRSSHSYGDRSRSDIIGATFAQQNNFRKRESNGGGPWTARHGHFDAVAYRPNNKFNLRLKRSSGENQIRSKLKLKNKSIDSEIDFSSSSSSSDSIFSSEEYNINVSDIDSESDTISKFKASDAMGLSVDKLESNSNNRRVRQVVDSDFEERSSLSRVGVYYDEGDDSFDAEAGRVERRQRDLDSASEGGGGGPDVGGSTCVSDFKTLTIGCGGAFDTMQFRTDCKSSSETVSVYSCHGGWVSENGSEHYLITTPLSRSSRGPRRYCFVYRLTEDGATLRFASSADTCRRENPLAPSPESLVLNITLTGKCLDVNLAHAVSSMSILQLLTLTLLCSLVSSYLNVR